MLVSADKSRGKFHGQGKRGKRAGWGGKIKSMQGWHKTRMWVGRVLPQQFQPHRVMLEGAENQLTYIDSTFCVNTTIYLMRWILLIWYQGTVSVCDDKLSTWYANVDSILTLPVWQALVLPPQLILSPILVPLPPFCYFVGLPSLVWPTWL